MNNGSAPGGDGLTTSFIKFFWGHIKTMVIDSLNAAFQHGQMSTTQKRAIITLIHKGKQLPRDDLNNWRPISLLNSDYKLLAKCLAIRLSGVLGTLIHENQFGFMKGRNISIAARTIDDTISYLDQANNPGVLLALDYKAAFDTISKEFILYAFKRFNFGNTFIGWVATLMQETESCIHYMGWLSEPIEINSGIRQGCSFSPMAFVLALELLAIKIRSDDTIKGLSLPTARNTNQEKILKLILYADDITLLLKDTDDVKNALTLVSYFSKFSGLAMNRQKSEAMWLGSQKYSDEQPCGFKFKSKIKILGIHFSNQKTASDIDENWTGKIEQVQKIIMQWTKRNCSIMGKICLVKSLLISQFTYLFQALIAPNKILLKLNTMFFRFIWKKRFSNTKAFEKVKRKIICQDVDKGGLNMIDVRDFQTSFVLGWIPKLLQQNEEVWKSYPNKYFQSLGGTSVFLQANVKKTKFKGIGYIQNKFWKSVLECWLENREKVNTDMNKQVHWKNVCPWNNILINYRGNTLFLRDWIDAGICYIDDLYENDVFMSYEKICEKVGFKPTRLFEYGAVRTAIGSFVRKINESQIQEIDVTDVDLLQTFKPKQFRKLLVDDYKTESICVPFWKRKLEMDIDKNIWLVANKATKEIRLLVLHWKITHNIYPTNIILHKMGIANNIYCTYCTAEIDYMEHFFFYCTKINKIWKLVEEDIEKNSSKRIHIDVRDALFGIRNVDRFTLAEIMHVNTLILIAKMCIGIYRYGTPIEIGCIFEKEKIIRNLL